MKKTIIAACAVALGAVLPVVAGPIVVPPVLGFPSASGQYRLLFITSGTTDATSSDPASYNKFVTDAANAVPELAALNTTWSAVAAIGSVGLVDNIGSSFVPMHRLDGKYVATGMINLIIGPLANLISVDENGNPVASARIWTGLLQSTDTLGQAQPGYGDLGADWGLHAGTADNTEHYHLYGISGVLQSPTPEPGTCSLIGLALAGLVTGRRRLARRIQP